MKKLILIVDLMMLIFASGVFAQEAKPELNSDAVKSEIPVSENRQMPDNHMNKNMQHNKFAAQHSPKAQAIRPAVKASTIQHKQNCNCKCLQNKHHEHFVDNRDKMYQSYVFNWNNRKLNRIPHPRNNMWFEPLPPPRACVYVNFEGELPLRPPRGEKHMHAPSQF